MTEITDFTMGFWAGWVVVITVVAVCFLSTLVYLVAGKTGKKIVSEDEVWDSDLREGNAEPPKWWFFLYLSLIIFSCGYLVLYPGLGSWKGTLGWTQFHQFKQAQETHAAEFGPKQEMWLSASLAEIAQDESSMRTAAALFVDNCSACHGRKGEGMVNMFPNLVDDVWQWGGSDEEIHASIANGRQAVMTPHAQVLGGAENVAQMAEYVRTLSGLAAKDSVLAASEQTFKSICAACHGKDGTGNTALGAPNLTDGNWLYGSDHATIVKTISQGRKGVMPAQQERLGPARTRLLASLVASGKLEELAAARI